MLGETKILAEKTYRTQIDADDDCSVFYGSVRLHHVRPRVNAVPAVFQENRGSVYGKFGPAAEPGRD